MELPIDFLEEMKGLLGTEYEAFEASYREVPKAGLRVNTIKAKADTISSGLPFSLTRIPWIGNGFYYSDTDTPSKHPYYYAGFYYLQEPSAMTPADILPVKPGDRVLDLCGAPGGKSTELGAKLKGEGCLFANDISHSRAKVLLKNLERFGISNIYVTSESPERLSDAFPEYFDKILVDAPCSGQGMFRKDPSMIRSYEERGKDYYVPVQREILSHAAKMVAPGGMLLYSTCTFSPEENEGAVQFLLDQFPEFSIVPVKGYERFAEGRPDWIAHGDPSLAGCIRIWPHRMGGEGHFAALLRKQGKETGQKKIELSRIKKESEALLPPEVLNFLNEIGWKDKEFLNKRAVMKKDGFLYTLPTETEVIPRLRYLRTGLLLGEVGTGKRFEPSQALAMILQKESCDSVVDLASADERVIRYLKGETIEVDELVPSCKKGWQLVCVDGYGLGWGKLQNGTLKNKYQIGWRWMA